MLLKRLKVRPSLRFALDRDRYPAVEKGDVWQTAGTRLQWGRSELEGTMLADRRRDRGWRISNRPASGPRDQGSLADQAMRGADLRLAIQAVAPKLSFGLCHFPDFLHEIGVMVREGRAREAAIFPFASTSG